MDNINVLYDELEGFLDERHEELQGKKITILEKGKEQMIELIHANLPDNMNLYKSEGNENIWNIVLLLSEPKEATKKKKSVEKKHFYNKDEKIIGEMVIEEIENQLLIKIKVKDESNYQEFKIENSFRVFHIINHIVTRYNYKEEIE